MMSVPRKSEGDVCPVCGKLISAHNLAEAYRCSKKRNDERFGKKPAGVV